MLVPCWSVDMKWKLGPSWSPVFRRARRGIPGGAVGIASQSLLLWCRLRLLGAPSSATWCLLSRPSQQLYKSQGHYLTLCLQGLRTIVRVGRLYFWVSLSGWLILDFTTENAPAPCVYLFAVALWFSVSALRDHLGCTSWHVRFLTGAILKICTSTLHACLVSTVVGKVW